MITIVPLKFFPEQTSIMGQLWFDALGRLWNPSLSHPQILHRFIDHLNDDQLPMTLTAVENNFRLAEFLSE
ncbi:hypothetical protein [Candidatus Paracaedibacter symbiosus]|uniref:hypothetical protein n=1 Tax=Candidatus Paracaedibacter symbiosus TaxID=244582 RepID=UPI00068C1972|nr:hypothetical protein [Candidatus Paracaedibacter symbiosus]